MLQSIQTIFMLKKEIPDAIGYDTVGPISFPLAKEIQESAQNNQLDYISLFSMTVYNFSAKVQKEIRILYSGDYEYQPIIKFSNREIMVRYEENQDNKELIIKEIPPNESISIEVFYPSKHFKIIQVLIGDHEITTLMQKLVEAKRYPSLVYSKMMMYILVLVFSIALAFLAFKIWETRQAHQSIQDAYSGFESCRPSLLKNPPGHEQVLERNYKKLNDVWKNHVLILNKVVSLEALKLKDEIVWCDPKK